jgi:hypothetical protein
MAKIVKDYGGISESLDVATKEPLIAAVSMVRYIDMRYIDSVTRLWTMSFRWPKK